MGNLTTLEMAWAEPTRAIIQAAELAVDLNQHLFDTLYHALALNTPAAVLVTTDRRYFQKCSHQLNQPAA